MDTEIEAEFEKEEAVRELEILNLLTIELQFVESRLLELLRTVAQHCEPKRTGSELGIESKQGNKNKSDNKTDLVSTDNNYFEGDVNHGCDLHITHKTQPTSSTSSSSAAPSRWFASSSHSWMDVSLHMDGYLIRHAQISLKLHKHNLNKKTSFRSSGSQSTFVTQVRQPRYPLVIQQLLQVHILAQKEIQRINYWKQSRMIEHIVNTEGRKSTLLALEFVDRIMQSLRKAIDVLCSPARDCFPQRLPKDNIVAPHFEPPLSQDLLIQCSILKDELIISAYGLHSLAKPPKQSAVLEDSWMFGQNSGMDLTGKQFSFPHRAVEVVEQVQVRFTIHSLGFVLDSLCEAHNITRKMKRKLEAHVDLEHMITDEQRRVLSLTPDNIGGQGKHYDNVLNPDPNITVSDWIF